MSVIGALVGFLLACACAQGSVAPPSAGRWRITPYTIGVAAGQPGVDQFKGSFTVRKGGAALSDLKGTSQHDANSGCAVGFDAKLLGRATIKHYDDPGSGDDFYWVGTGTELWETLRFTFQAKHSRKSHKAKGKLRIYFPGGTNAIIGNDGGFGSLEVTNSTVGFCNLNFDVSS